MTDDLFGDDEDEMVLRVNVPPTLAKSAEISHIKATQDAFGMVVDDLTALYRDFDKSRRQKTKGRLKALYERLKELGEVIGVSRMSLDHLWKG